VRQHGAMVCVVLTVSVAGACFGQTQKPCFAFLLKGDVSVSCEGRTTQITHRGDVMGFAVSDEQLSFAYTTSRITKETATAAWVAHTTTLIDLKSGGSKPLAEVRGVVSTCGGIFPIGDARGIHSSARDLMTGDEVSFPPYIRFRCSSDRNSVVGTTKDQGGDLYEGTSPITKIAAAERFDVYLFNLSPNGSKTAYWADLRALCVFSASSGRAQCMAKHGTLADMPSVNDSGEVLVAKGTGQECFYRSMYDFSPTPLPGATDEDRDECLGIGYWKPGLESIEIIEPLGRNPQWLTPAAAELLRNWSARPTGRTGN
jgi:hypothetical protein